MKPICCIVILMPLVSACATLQSANSPTTSQREYAELVEILQGGTLRPFKSLGEVKGSGCQKSTFDTNIPESDAIQDLKLQAAAVSADAVMSTACRNATIDWFTDCFKLTVCSGEAIRFLDK